MCGTGSIPCKAICWQYRAETISHRNEPCEGFANKASVEAQGSRNYQLPAFFLVVALVALVCWLFGGFWWLPGLRWDPNKVTIKGFRAGVTREQIEARLGPGSTLSDRTGWTWSPPKPAFKPGGPLPTITFEMLTLEKWENRWHLHGSRFEYGGEKFVTQIHCADSIWQGKLTDHFGPGTKRTNGNEMSISYQFPTNTKTKLSFNIDLTDEFGPPSTRAVTGTTISWPDSLSNSPQAPTK